MQEELFCTLRRVGISDEAVELETVTLNREQNLLTVFFFGVTMNHPSN